jgi:hypothetical protein
VVDHFVGAWPGHFGFAGAQVGHAVQQGPQLKGQEGAGAAGLRAGVEAALDGGDQAGEDVGAGVGAAAIGAQRLRA